MKKFKRVMLSLILLISFFFINCLGNIPDVGSKCHKEVNIRGKHVLLDLQCIRVEEYDKDGFEIYVNDIEYGEKKLIKPKRSLKKPEVTIYYENGKSGFDREMWIEKYSYGNLIHTEKDCEGYEAWYEYDSNGKLIYRRQSVEGGEFWYEYNSQNDLIFEKKIEKVTKESHAIAVFTRTPIESILRDKMIKIWYEYDNKRNMIHQKDNKKNESWHEYDNKGKRIHTKTNNNIEIWYEYDSKGNLIYEKKSVGKSYFYENIYEDNRILKYKITYKIIE